MRVQVLFSFTAASRIAASAIAAATLFPVPLSAAEEGQIAITVSDAATKAPLPLARVLLRGPVFSQEYTGPDGRVVFKDAPNGLYVARVSKSGYQDVTSEEFEVTEGRAVDVDVALAKSVQIKTLGTVVVSSTAAVSSSTVSESSVVRRLSPTLTDALAKVSGVLISSDPSAGDEPTETVSLEGHDPTEVALTLDGIPFNAPGTAADLRQLNTDLFSAASARFGPVGGALGGGLNLRTLDPTSAWRLGLSQEFGTYGQAASVFSEQGPLGRLGLVYVHSVRGEDNPLAGRRYLDTSGFDYVHAGADQPGGDLVKLRARLGAAHNLAALFMSSNRYRDSLCTDFTGPLPCGFGPGNFSFRHLAFGSLTDNALIGQTAVRFSLFGTESRSDRDLLARYLAGILSPTGTETRERTRGAVLNVQFAARERHALSIEATTTSWHSHVASLLAAKKITLADRSASYASLALADSVKPSPQLTLTGRLGFSSAGGAGSAPLAGLSAQWHPATDDAYMATVDIGNAAPTPSRLAALSNPASLRFNCVAGLAFGSGPGDAPGAQSSFSARLTWQHQLRAGQFSATLYHQTQHDALITVPVNATSLPAGYFPAGIDVYVAEVQSIFDSPGGCNAGAAPFLAQNLYISLPVGNIRRAFDGIRLNGAITVSRSLFAQPYYDIQVVKAFSADPRLTNPYSVVVSGAQFPNVPMHRAGITLDYKTPESPVEWLADAQYVSANNPQNLPAYATADAGIAFNLQHGTFVVAASNLFNAHGADFATARDAVPLPSVGGTPLATIARPLLPRRITVTYSVKIGAGGGAAQASTAPLGGSFLNLLPPLPQAPPARPFELDANRTSCRPGDAKSAAASLDGLKAYVADVEAAKTAAGYPDAPPANTPDIPGFAVEYYRNEGSYALVLWHRNLKSLRHFALCAPVHVGTVDEARALHLFVPPSTSLVRNPLAYTPRAGLYIIRQPLRVGQEEYRLYRLPAAAPANPLAVRPSDRCADGARATAAQLLSSLATYVVAYERSPASALSPPGWKVKPHPTKSGSYWLELELTDFAALPTLLNCARVATGSEAEVKAVGYGGARAPSLSYAPPLGLYLIRSQRP